MPPHMEGGGVAHGPNPRDYEQSLPRKVSKLARKSVLSAKVKENKIVILEDFSMDEPKSKKVMDIIKNLKLDTTKVLFITKEVDKNLVLSSRNIPYIKVQKAPDFSVYDVINSQFVFFKKAPFKL